MAQHENNIGQDIEITLTLFALAKDLSYRIQSKALEKSYLNFFIDYKSLEEDLKEFGAVMNCLGLSCDTISLRLKQEHKTP